MELANGISRDTCLLQLVGLTASVGLGDAKNEFAAKSYILSFCSRLDVQQHPSQVIEYIEELEAIKNPPIEGIAVAR